MRRESFRLRCAAAALTPFNAQVRDRLAAGPHPPDEAAAAALFLLLDEVLTNIIKYGHPAGDGAEHEIAVCIALNATEFVIDIEDDGLPFDPTVRPAASGGGDGSWEDRPVGGWGLALVQRTVDAAEYRRDQCRNKLTLRKRLGRAADGARAARGPDR